MADARDDFSRHLSSLNVDTESYEHVKHIARYVDRLEHTLEAPAAPTDDAVREALRCVVATVQAWDAESPSASHQRDLATLAAALTDRTAAIAAAREAGREEQRALDAEAHGEVVVGMWNASAQVALTRGFVHHSGTHSHW